MYWDHGIFVMVAQAVRGGAAPYLTAYDTKGPVAFLPYALALGLPVDPSTSVRIADIIALALTAVLVERGLRAYVPTVLGRRLVTTFVVLGYVASGAVMTAQIDGWCALLLTVAALWALVGFRRAPFAYGVMYGVAVAVAVCVKPTFLIFVLPPLAAAPWLARDDRARLVHGIVGMTVGGVVTAAAVLLWLGSRGGLAALVEVQWNYNRTVYAGTASLSYARRAGELVHELLRGSQFFMLPVLVPGVMALFGDRGVPRAARAYAAATLAAGVVNLVVQGKFLPYHWFPVTVPLTVVAGIGYARALRGLYAHEAFTPAVRGAVASATFEHLVGFQLTTDQLKYNATR